MKFIIRHRRIIVAVIAVAMFAFIVYCAIKTNGIQQLHGQADVYDGEIMGTVYKKTIYSGNKKTSDEVNNAIDASLEELENKISVRLVNSMLSKCNAEYGAGGIYPFTPDILDYLREEMDIYKETTGAFSPCLLPVIKLWGIEYGEKRVPSDTDIKEALECSNPFNIEIMNEGVIFHGPSMQLEMGAVGKGIACDLAVEELRKYNVQGAVISVGGSVAVYGIKAIGQNWNIGIQDPRGEYGEYLGVIQTNQNMMISTSGDYEKYFEDRGKRYHHIFDPHTGYPADSGLMSVTIVSDRGFLSDALSTACFVMGLEDGMAYAKKKGVEAIFVTTNKEVYVTDGIKKSFHLKATDYTIKDDAE